MDYIAEFNNHKPLYVIEEYEGPLIYTFVGKSKNYYLAYYCEDVEGGKKWLYASANLLQIDDLLTDKLSVRKFFENSLAIFTVKANNGVVSEAVKIGLDDVPTGYIPEEG